MKVFIREMSSPRDGKKGKIQSLQCITIQCPFSNSGYHSFELHTFDHPKHCDACHKLLYGCYFQGYFCTCK